MNLVTVGSSSSDAGKNKCKGPEAGVPLACARGPGSGEWGVEEMSLVKEWGNKLCGAYGHFED